MSLKCYTDSWLNQSTQKENNKHKFSRPILQRAAVLHHERFIAFSGFFFSPRFSFLQLATIANFSVTLPIAGKGTKSLLLLAAASASIKSWLPPPQSTIKGDISQGRQNFSCKTNIEPSWCWREKKRENCFPSFLYDNALKLYVCRKAVLEQLYFPPRGICCRVKEKNEICGKKFCGVGNGENGWKTNALRGKWNFGKANFWRVPVWCSKTTKDFFAL